MDAVGKVVILTPEPAYVPPQEPVYHTHIAPVPRLPPFLLTKAPEPIHIVPGRTDTESGTTEFVFSVTVVLLQAVVLHAPCART